jgi:hypothetical protein
VHPNEAHNQTERTVVKIKIFAKRGTPEATLSRASAGCKRKTKDWPNAAQEHKRGTSVKPAGEA